VRQLAHDCSRSALLPREDRNQICRTQRVYRHRPALRIRQAHANSSASLDHLNLIDEFEALPFPPGQSRALNLPGYRAIANAPKGKLAVEIVNDLLASCTGRADERIEGRRDGEIPGAISHVQKIIACDQQ